MIIHNEGGENWGKTNYLSTLIVKREEKLGKLHQLYMLCSVYTLVNNKVVTLAEPIVIRIRKGEKTKWK